MKKTGIDSPKPEDQGTGLPARIGDDPGRHIGRLQVVRGHVPIIPPPGTASSQRYAIGPSGAGMDIGLETRIGPAPGRTARCRCGGLDDLGTVAGTR